MQPSTERIINGITGGDSIRETELNALLNTVERLVNSKAATMPQMEETLRIVCTDFSQGFQDTMNTHL